MHQNKGLLTIAIGKKYALQAKYLAYSCMLHASHIIRAVITDEQTALENFYDILIPYNSELGDPFSVKTRLHLYTPFEKTLFLDADSLLIYNIDSYWDVLEKNSFAYTGELIDKGIWYLDISTLIKKISVPMIPKFNSGMFLFKKNESSNIVFETAFAFLQNSKDMGIPFFRGTMLPDEPFLAMAFAKHNIKPIRDYGRFSRTLIGASKIHLNVIKGIAFFIKNKRMVSPLVVHFCGKLGNLFFLREKIRLFFYFHSPLDCFLTLFLPLIRDLWKKVQKK